MENSILFFEGFPYEKGSDKKLSFFMVSNISEGCNLKLTTNVNTETQKIVKYL